MFVGNFTGREFSSCPFFVPCDFYDTLYCGRHGLPLVHHIIDISQYPAVIEKLPLFKDSTLEIEIIPGVAKCTKCGEIYNLVENKGYCPKCNSFDKDIIDGKDLVLKEVLAK